jgi:ATP-binding cassette subfamily C protein LapB
LLVGLYEPQRGTLLLDGTDLRQIERVDLRRNIGYLPQNVVLFAGTVRDNLLIGAPHVDDAQMLRAAAMSGLMEHVNRHPLGFDLPVGERGEALSGGQRQTVALARALLLDPPILVLDEPTQGMDRAAEERLKARIAETSRERTVIIVTHRESLLSIIDTLVIVDNGKVVAMGPKEAVLRALSEGKVPVAR